MHLVRKDTFGTYKSKLSQYGTDYSNFVEAAINSDSKDPVMSHFLKSPYVETAVKRESKGLGKQNSESVSEKPVVESAPAYEFNMRKYLLNNGLNIGKCGFDRNLSVCEGKRIISLTH